MPHSAGVVLVSGGSWHTAIDPLWAALLSGCPKPVSKRAHNVPSEGSPTWRSPSTRSTTSCSSEASADDDAVPEPGSIWHEPASCEQPSRTQTCKNRGLTCGLLGVDSIDHYGNRRPRVEGLVSAWNQGIREDAESEDEADDPLIGASAEPKTRPRTRLTDEEVDAMRTARANGVSVTALAIQFGVHRGTVWARTREIKHAGRQPLPKGKS